jgi:glycosyltransferase involved in cell wall biosynthesis
MGSTDHIERRIRVVIGCDTFPPDINGAARFAERLGGGLARRGHDVHIIAPGYSSAWGTFTEEHDGALMTVHRVKSYKLPQHETLRYVWPFTLRHRIDTLLDEIKPDVVHIQSHLIMGRHLVPSAKARGIRVIATNHIMPENLIKYSVIIPRWFESTAMKMAWADSGRILRQCDAVTTPTRRAAELLEAAAGVTGVLAISCGIDASKFANSTPTSNLNPRVLFLGRLDYEKHIHNLLRAVAKLPKDLKTQVELVGKGGEQDYLEQLANELGIRDQVTFFGHITEQDLPKAYERATVFAMPSIAELQSIATMEAMASGRPVVAADAMALPHLVHDGDNGYLFPPDDIDAFADRLKRVLTASPAELERLSENSLYLIQAHDIQRTLTVFEQLYMGTFAGTTSDDNLPGYSEPIGRLGEAGHSQVQSLRERAEALVERVDDVRDNLRERFGDYRADVRERIRDARAKATRMDRKVRIAMRKAQKRVQRER